MAIPFQVTFDCADPGALAPFWAAVLGYELQPPPTGFDSWEAWLRHMDIPESEWNSRSAVTDPDGNGPRIFFQRVPESKSAKNRVHLDVNVGGPPATLPEQRRPRVDEAVERAIALGARVLYAKDEHGEYWVTLADPEGNEFCMQ